MSLLYLDKRLHTDRPLKSAKNERFLSISTKSLLQLVGYDTFIYLHTKGVFLGTIMKNHVFASKYLIA